MDKCSLQGNLESRLKCELTDWNLAGEWVEKPTDSCFCDWRSMGHRWSAKLAGGKERERARIGSVPSLTRAAARTSEDDGHCCTSTLQIEDTPLFLQTPTWDRGGSSSGTCLNRCLCQLLSLGVMLATFIHVVVCSKCCSFSVLHNISLHNSPIILFVQLLKGIEVVSSRWLLQIELPEYSGTYLCVDIPTHFSWIYA